MTEDIVYTTDPLGRKIYIAKNLCCLENIIIDSPDQLDDLFSVLKKPAILIETTSSPAEYLYFRSIGWNLSVLMQVKLTYDFWEAYKCTINPLDADIVELLRDGRQII